MAQQQLLEEEEQALSLNDQELVSHQIKVHNEDGVTINQSSAMNNDINSIKQKTSIEYN